MSRFDFIKYDAASSDTQAAMKEAVEQVEHLVECLQPGRYRALAVTALEEAYCWIGKAIRDDQIARKGSTVPQEERTNS